VAEAAPLVLTGARLPGQPGTWDIRLASGRIAGISPAASAASGGAVSGSDAGERIDLDGRFVLPGLWDEHVHFTLWSLHRRRLDLSRTRSAAEAAAVVRAHIDDYGLPTAGFLVGVGFRDAVWNDTPTRRLLDEAAPTYPVVLLSSDLHCAWLNSVAARSLGIQTGPDGLLREEAAFRVTAALDELPDAVVDSWAAEAQAAAASRGVVGIVDLEMNWNRDVWRRRAAAGQDLLRVEFGIYPGDLERAIEEGLRSGDVVDQQGLVTVGCLKVLIDGSLNTRTAYCVSPYLDPSGLPDPHGLLTVPPEALEQMLVRSSANGIAPTVHAIGDAANRVALDTFERVGIGGRIEHAQLLEDEDLARFAAQGIVASVQPRHAPDDRDVADRHWAGRTERAFRYRSLLEAGTTLAFGSDAPVSPLDPWLGISAAVFRTADERGPWHPEEAVPVADALASSARGRRGIQVGEVADLAIAELDPLTVADPVVLGTLPIAATLLGGRFTHRTF
jgi:predicted amidohydrolase YtcJ